MAGFGSDASNLMDMQSLSDLLKESDEQTRLREQETVPPVVAAPTQVVTSSSRKAVEEAKSIEATDPLAIWKEDEIPNEEDLIDKFDKRPTPKYEFFFKTLVGSEDVFLGLHDKSPSVQDCTHLVVKIHFPGATMKDLDLDVTRNRIKASSASLKLFTYLPVPVESDQGKAKFDSKKNVLSVTLPIILDEFGRALAH